MKHDATHYALLAASWAAVAVAAGVLWRQAATLPEPMPPDELERTVRKLRSDAFEAQTLALHLARGELTRHFAEQQHRKLGDDLVDVRKALDAPPPRGREADAASARAAVARLEALVKSVPVAMADEGALRRIADEEAGVARSLARGRP